MKNTLLFLSMSLLLSCNKTVTNEHRIAIFLAAENGDAAYLKRELKLGADPNMYSEERGYLLTQAVFSENPEVTRALLNAGAHVNSRKGQGFTPLLRAVYIFNCEPAKILLKAGADPNVQILNSYELEGGSDYKYKNVKEVYMINKKRWPKLWERNKECWLEFEKILSNNAKD